MNQVLAENLLTDSKNYPLEQLNRLVRKYYVRSTEELETSISVFQKPGKSF